MLKHPLSDYRIGIICSFFITLWSMKAFNEDFLMEAFKVYESIKSILWNYDTSNTLQFVYITCVLKLTLSNYRKGDICNSFTGTHKRNSDTLWSMAKNLFKCNLMMSRCFRLIALYMHHSGIETYSHIIIE